MKYNNNDHDKYVAEYDRLYELFDQDPQEAVYAVMDLERKINDLNGCDKYAKQLEKDIEKLESKLYPLMHAKNVINSLKHKNKETVKLQEILRIINN